MLLPDAVEDEEVVVFKSPPKKESLSIPAHPQASSSATPTLSVPPQSMCPSRTPVSLVPLIANLPGVSPSPCNHLWIHTLGTILSSLVSPPSLLANCQGPPLWTSFSPVKPLGLYHCPMGMTPVTPSHCITPALQSASLSHGLQDMARSIQDLCQALLTAGSSVGLHVSGPAGAVAPAANITTPQPRAMPLDPLLLGTTKHPLDNFDIPSPAPPLPPVSGQGDFAGAQLLSPIREEPATPMMLPPPLPEEEQSSAIVKELSPSVNFMDVDAPPSPPRVNHSVTGAPLHSHSLVMHLPLLPAPVMSLQALYA
ncbi:hypothetical protein ARMGADRAFT_1073797 [Armillaria gallica]|uniref:Uncharacterized protein n=1 Tax=Armillaria gallica TaxID=47427 RepID=A0A2H3ENS4_ARMGA|nr:hypothetical protein ARMGADRAFT_1073797 [Armillaria gallica]